MDFPEGDSNYQDFPENNTTSATATSPRPNFIFLTTMVANRPWLAMDVVVVPRAQHPLPNHPEKLLPKFDPDNDITPKDHIEQFIFSLILLDVQHEDV
ncbi:unnamed protein product, partial [Adineta steineri]